MAVVIIWELFVWIIACMVIPPLTYITADRWSKARAQPKPNRPPKWKRKRNAQSMTPVDELFEDRDRVRGTPHMKGGRKQKNDPFVDFAAAYIQIHMRSEEDRLAAERHEREH